MDDGKFVTLLCVSIYVSLEVSNLRDILKAYAKY